MAMNFGKNNRSVAFDPTSAFPLDARSYFESLEAAQAEAKTAIEAGTKGESAYYYGQTIVVVDLENKKATLYIIQPDNTLSPVGGDIESSQITINEKQFKFDDNGNLSLNIDDGKEGQILTAGPDGTLAWVDPIDTYTKTEIDTKLAAAGHLNRIIVDSVDAINEYLDKDDFNQYIFMVAKFKNESDKYDEYIIIEAFDSEGVSQGKSIEKVGSWEVNLDDYAKKTDLNNYVKNDVEGSRLITSDEADKLSRINENAEENYIKDVSIDFSVDDNGKLNLSNLFITGLSNKVDKYNDNDLLVSSKDREILDSLIANDGKVEISGSVTASQVVDLETWLNNNAGSVKGLSQNNLTDNLYNKLVNLEENYIKSVDDNQLNVNEVGQLSIKSIAMSNVVDLESILNNKVNKSDLADINAELDSQNSRLEQVENALIWNKI